MTESSHTKKLYTEDTDRFVSAGASLTVSAAWHPSLSSNSQATPPEWIFEVQQKTLRMFAKPLQVTQRHPTRDQIDHKIQRILDDIVLGPSFPFPYVMYAERLAAGESVIRITVSVYDRETGEPIDVKRSTILVPDRYYADPANRRNDVIRIVFDSLRELMMHELEEAFRVNNEMIFDPHSDRPERWP